ncbi:VOC family protein [Actinoplanes sp. NPDC049265]|uniref:VOC family protein n=1 Tax=Actinoplanes sp. NPDC049265 TaxID=3363902 RepID=UPI00371AEF45
MSVPPRVSLATLGVTDVARATEFYETLGWRLSPASVPAMVSYFETSGARLSLVKTDDVTAHAEIAPRTSTDFRGVTLTIGVDSPEAVDEALRTAVRAGAALVKSGVRTPWGGYLGYFTDPDGHLWSISYEPH